METNQTTGKAGQKAAENFLIKKGYKFLARNYQIKSGEIDLVVRDREFIVFVEVKARRGLEHGYPREAVGFAKQKKIIGAAKYYLYKKELTESPVRFDVVEVLINQDQMYISHIENAFTA